LARYIVRASGASGPVEFLERLTIDQALEKTEHLRDADFTHIVIVNELTGTAIKDVEELLRKRSTD
jgi:hypothetical protein